MAEQSGDAPLDNLLAKLVDQRITADEIAALESILMRDPIARRRYVHYLDLHEELLGRAKLDRLLPESPRPRTTARSRMSGGEMLRAWIGSWLNSFSESRTNITPVQQNPIQDQS